MGAMGILCNAVFVRHGKPVHKNNKACKACTCVLLQASKQKRGNKNNKWQFQLYLSFVLVVIEYHWQHHKR